MTEKRTEMRAFMVRLLCHQCCEGDMEATGITLTSYPPQYPHKCNKCGAETITTGQKYPRVEWEEV